MQDYKVVFSGEDRLSPQVKKIKNEIQGLSGESAKIDKIQAKFDRITNSSAPLERKLKDLKTIMANMKFDGLEKTDVFQRVSNEAQRMAKAIKSAQNEINGISAKGGGFGDGISSKLTSAVGSISSMAAIGGAAATAIGAIGYKLAELTTEGIKLAQEAEGIRYRFQQIGGTQTYLEELREHTHGLVNDLELMKATVKANDFNIPMKDLGKYLEFAQLKSQQTGESVDYLVNSIVTGLGRQSVQILDNLGLSAAELKEKMAEGKTMTEAVAEVIDKQLSEAGEHFETTAEKAQRKLVELQNEQMRVGEGLAPLKSDWDAFWTSLEIGAMKFIQTLGSIFSEAQRIQNLVNGMQTSGSGSQAHIHKFNSYGSDDAKRKYITKYTNLQNKQINKVSGRIAEIERDKNSGRGWNVKELKRLKEQREALRANRDEFLRYANAQLKAKKVNPITPITDTKTPKVGGRTTHKQTPLEKVKENGQERFENQLRKTDNELIVPIEYKPTKTSEQLKEEIFGNTSTWTDELQGNIDSLFAERWNIQAKFDAGEMNLEDAQAALDKISEMLKLDVPFEIDTSKVEKTKETLRTTSDYVGQLGNSLGELGSAFELPDLNVAAAVAQAIATIVGAYAETLAMDKSSKSNIWTFIAAAAAATISMVSTIASIKKASGFANGGVIGGNSYSGDKLLARVNSGEVILPAKKASELGDMLTTNAQENYSTVDFKIKGSDLYGTLHNYSKVKAKSGKITGIK